MTAPNTLPRRMRLASAPGKKFRGMHFQGHAFSGSCIFRVMHFQGHAFRTVCEEAFWPVWLFCNSTMPRVS
jgi:hypothetical protein